jgi:hypothetical protein
MNSKGQFSIIAALLVAVVLIATVIVTYSTIRNSPIQDQPQILSAIDETNFAIKQILGFTVGYYGSVLKVTGNSLYARTLAMEYLHSGLVNIANMHPEWGASFSVEGSGLYAYWFTNTSYSGGNLAVKYNLTGLGIYGIAYETSCRLMVQIENTVSNNQTQLAVTKDEGEPLIHLGKQNFKFYRYIYTNSTWKLITPSTEPVAFANGTYIIDIPSGIDPYSYLIQVEDPRGLIVVASSFSRYTCTLTWNPENTEHKYAVTGSTSEITGAPDGNYATIGQGGTCEVIDYQGGTGTIKQVYFNIHYYGSVSGTLEWYYQLGGGGWNKIENLPQGGSPASPLTRTYNATSLRASWTWDNLNTTDIQFKNNGDKDSENAYVDAMHVTVVVQTADYYSTLQDATITAELLQNGTMRWLGQNLQLTTQAKPIPPIPVKSIHINQTINNVNQEVPFQIEDWASNYRIPLGLTNNASVFSSKTMLVFLVNPNVSKVTIWWNGSDTATQTPYAYINRYFTGDDTDNGILTNGILTLDVITSGNDFKIKSTLGTSENIARFMRINSEWSTYGADPAYVIHHGIVRDIIHQEAEWSDGANNCPNLYAHIVLTLPANATYYTYQLRLMFVESQKSRSISDLSLIQLKTTVSEGKWGSDWSKIVTENGTATGLPSVSYDEGFFYNFSDIFENGWAHHWSELVENDHGFGVMMPTEQNLQLYALDKIAGDKTGCIDIDDSHSYGSQTVTIEVKPASSLAMASFTHALDLIWYGAVVTFDGDNPIYPDTGGTTGLWITVEYPPTITVTTEN